MIRAQADWIVRKRDGRIVPYETTLVTTAITNAFRAELNLAQSQPIEDVVEQEIQRMVEGVTSELAPLAGTDDGVEVEKIQDFVELELMRQGHYRIARRYIVYRSEHAKVRALRAEDTSEGEETKRIHITLEDGARIPFDQGRVRARLLSASKGLEEFCSVDEILDEVMRQVFDGISSTEIYRTMILAARSSIERDPAYDTLASRLMLMVIYNDALQAAPDFEGIEPLYRSRFEHYIIDGINAERLCESLREFDLAQIAEALQPQRDHNFKYLGLQAIYDRYLLHIDGRRIETPQFFWMRVAMGLAIEEGDQKEQRAIEFYNVLSQFWFTSATPTLFNSATKHPQLSSCYLSTVTDDLEHIFKCVSDNAMLSKWAGGLGNDWTNVRATNSYISGTNGQSQGVIPF